MSAKQYHYSAHGIIVHLEPKVNIYGYRHVSYDEPENEMSKCLYCELYQYITVGSRDALPVAQINTITFF